MIFRHSKSFQKISKENICGGAILVYNRYSGQPVCNLTKRRTPPTVFSGKIFENGWLLTAALNSPSERCPWKHSLWSRFSIPWLLWTVSLSFDQKKDSTTVTFRRNIQNWMAQSKRKISKKTFLVEWFLYNCYSEQSDSNLTKRRTLPPRNF